MKTQVNIPNSQLPLFISVCDKHQVIYHQIDARDKISRYEIDAIGAQQFWLGVDLGKQIVLNDIEHGK